MAIVDGRRDEDCLASQAIAPEWRLCSAWWNGHWIWESGAWPLFCIATLQRKGNSFNGTINDERQERETEMSDATVFQTGNYVNLRSRSMGLKLLVVGVLALLMTIPALFVWGWFMREARER
jgi:hypothetical protein